ncbi:rhodanese-like domain-containing protein [Dokdonella fugitiva]|jgi:rhodanese-related sulfurtransferase|uniref:Rhodanese-related sulfurtransferase n=1 Tax=Dokdonella fugitiva TaxID=328517 RepID=A0A4R2IH90_9GAMM|nr:rhodanese-like domain-containing protein [Dokdonella fugitiva]MBA8882914.1 rhodanese-related sulfurtransferase [Dokdonella fugitiva]TCO43108.1 rhodanese-related sulfurtransferase [Dokdonella fugitiva]
MSDVLHRLPEFLGNHFYLTLAFVGVFVALLVTEAQRFTRGYAALTPAGLTQLINRENALVVDVSALAEFEKGHIPGAKHVAMSALDPAHKDLAKAREQPIALVCRNGQTSAQAAQRLKKAGFQKVFWLEGGVAAWNEAQMPLVKGRA